MPAELELLLTAQNAAAIKAIEQVGAETKGLADGVKKTGKNLTEAFAVGAIASYGKSAIKAAEDAASAQRVTAQLVQQTGAAAWTSSGQIDSMVKSLKDTTAVSGGVIREGANILLTFKNVQNAGEGLDAVFNRANAAALDLAAAGFGSAEGNAKLLGKALNDPVAGLTALTRAGVTFTDAQKEQIKQLTKSGDVLAAQKIILGEVESQVGGTAAAAVTSSDRMRIAYGDMKKSIGEGLLPVMQALLPFVQLLSQIVGENADVIAPLIALVLALVVAMKAWAIIQGIINGLLLANPVGLVVVAIVALVAVVLLLIKHWETLKGWLDVLWQLFKDYGLYLAGPFGIALKVVIDNFDKIRAAADRLMDMLRRLKDLAGGLGDVLGRIKPWGLPGGGAPDLLGAATYGALGGGGGGILRPVTINVTAPFGSDPYRMGDEIVRAIARYESRNAQPFARP